MLQNLALLGVGTTADATNPFSAKLNNALWAAKTVAEGGDGHLRYKLSKESAAKTLSLLMQTNFSGRAEVGLTGDDDFHFKVSPDGSAWTDAIVIDRSTGKLTLAGFTSPAATRQLLSAAPLDAAAYNGMQLNGGMEASQEHATGSVTLTGSGSLQTKYLVDGVMAAYRGSFVAAGQQVTDAPAGYRNSREVHGFDRAKLARIERRTVGADADRRGLHCTARARHRRSLRRSRSAFGSRRTAPAPIRVRSATPPRIAPIRSALR